MKETTGATILMGLAAMILLIFIIVVAFFIGYGKAFRLKNRIINTIERYEGVTVTELKNVMDLTNNAYSGNEADICYSKVNDASGDFFGFTMSVTVYMETDEKILKLKIPVSGETRIIQTGTYYEELSNGHDPFVGTVSECTTGWTKVTLH